MLSIHKSLCRFLVIAVAFGAAWLGSPAKAAFVDITADCGLEFFYDPETGTPIGAGVVWEDFDRDGDYDLYAVEGADCNHLFLNNGDSTFSEVANAAGASNCGGAGHGATSADYDNDGDADIYVTNAGQNRLYRNMLIEDGVLSFRHETNLAGMNDDGGGNSSSATWADYDNDGFLDLFVVQHVISTEPPVCWPDLVWHNNGDGTFDEVADRLDLDLSGNLNIAGCGLGVTTSDYDDDGDQDLMIINDFGPAVAPNRLFRNDGPGFLPGSWNFTDVSAASGFDYEMYGMGIAIGDYNGDGFLDYYMADIGDNNLGRSNGDGTFTDTTVFAGVEANDFEIYGERGLVSWGPVFADLDHDGREDLCVANGGAPPEIWPGMFGEEYVNLNPIYCYRNDGDGTFTEGHQELGLTHERYYRNVTFVDFDRDGDLDLHFGNLQGAHSFYRNDLTGPDTNWLTLKAHGTIGNADAVGARVLIKDGTWQQQREVDGGSTFTSMSMRTVHFGTRDAEELDEVLVVFQSGLTFNQRHVTTNQHLEVWEPIYTVEADVDDVTVSPGGTVAFDLTVSNETTSQATFEAWIDFRKTPDGEVYLLDGPIEYTLAGGESETQAVNLEMPAEAPVGATGELILKVGRFDNSGDDVIHKVYVDVTVE